MSWVVMTSIQQDSYCFGVNPYKEPSKWKNASNSIGLLSKMITDSLDVPFLFVDPELQIMDSSSMNHNISSAATMLDAFTQELSSRVGEKVGFYISVPVEYIQPKTNEKSILFIREKTSPILRKINGKEKEAFQYLGDLLCAYGVGPR